ncbi:MAG: YigZ family protein, partial [Bacteroidota bacterium]
MTNYKNNIKTLKAANEYRFKENGSLFITICEPILTEEEAIGFLSKIKRQYYDATHHCYSYITQNGSFKFSDDGEPSGTAGKRIYNAQNHFDVTNLITIVIRYFGGTKLGVGLLGKAYYNSAFQCLSNSIFEEKELYNRITITYDFAFSKTVHHFVTKYRLI